MVDVDKNTSFVEGNYIDELVIVIHSIVDNHKHIKHKHIISMCIP